MTNKYDSPNRWLAAELAERRAGNPRFSLRTMAKMLGLSPGRLSELISGKRTVTRKQAEKIFDRLNYSPEKRRQLLPLFASVPDGKYSTLSSDTFHVIAEGAHLAFLCLMDMPDFKSDLLWLANRLNASPTQVQTIVDRLIRVNLIEWDGSGWTKTQKNLETSTDIQSVALRLSHKESMLHAVEALDEVAIELRDITSITMAIDPAKLPQAKKMIRNFRRKMGAYLEEGTRRQVYNLNIQLVPVTTLEKGERA